MVMRATHAVSFKNNVAKRPPYAQRFRILRLRSVQGLRRTYPEFGEGLPDRRANPVLGADELEWAVAFNAL
jgi:hypothetical protein